MNNYTKNRIIVLNKKPSVSLNNCNTLINFIVSHHFYNGELGKMKTECTVCGAEIELAADAVQGELLECPECGTELEVISVDPPVVQEAPQEEEDWGQ
jgi:alpha-aminoadipate carrier protein LysW